MKKHRIPRENAVNQKILLLLSGLTLPLSSHASGWAVVEKIDAMTDQKEQTAAVVNAAGHKFSVYRIRDGEAVWANFRLSSESTDQVAPDKPLTVRIDKNKPQEIDVARGAVGGLRFSEWEPKWINFLIWHGKEASGVSDTIIQLIEGTAMIIRYHLPTGGYKDTEFTLTGAHAAITKTLGISGTIDKEKHAKDKAFRMRYIEATNACFAGRESKECLQGVNACRERSGEDIGRFESCLAE